MQYQAEFSHKVAIYQIWLQYLIPNTSYRPETTIWTDRRTDGPTNQPTDKLTPIYPPKLRLWGYNNKITANNSKNKQNLDIWPWRSRSFMDEGQG
jgi:hypothetical protein